MTQTITAIFENGVLRPLTHLDLPEHTEVQVLITLLPQPTPAEGERRRIHAALVAAGLALPVQEPPQTPPLSDAERNALAQRIPVGRSLSELIIEEREDH